ncbi:hypothetical protein M406DRAFT_332401 [Cryphonectria parasitica EP155]|uniref:Uncharacterized protein n=1 Tax=Cryphonectria parasitica (strain ATCC 38755 / EP155) TaxID=660469 RepID=A0A9P4XZN2_CRYP1|nr:uncharacterized protein M406DRAFT_332401 [Cryphonectria parasitica EP155]KAF3763963.1 hypothetical protein M406DRAFT_332401 [Cryphonectria parasitica EP155]
MSRGVPVTALVLGLLTTPSLCLPKPELQQNERQHDIRDSSGGISTASGLSNWEIVVISLSIMVGVLVLCCLGGACEALLCNKRSRVHASADATPNELDFGCRGSADSTPTLRGDDDKDEEKCLDFNAWKGHADKTNAIADQDRFSWQDEQGITTEVFQDGSLPGAGQPRRGQHMANVNGYQSSANMAMRGQMSGQEHHLEARSPGARGPGLLNSPQFLIGDEQDEEDYEREVAGRHMHEVAISPVSSSSPTAVWTDESGHSTPTKAPRMPWADDNEQSHEEEKTAKYSADTKEEERFSLHGGIHHEQELAEQHNERRDLLPNGRRITHVFPWMPAEDD